MEIVIEELAIRVTNCVEKPTPSPLENNPTNDLQQMIDEAVETAIRDLQRRWD